MLKNYLTATLVTLAVFVSLTGVAQTFKFEGINYNVVSAADKTAEVSKNGTTPSVVTIPAVVSDGTTEYTVVRVGNGAFLWNDYITQITLPETILSLEENAFNMSALKEIEIPDNVTAIGKQAFNCCSSLERVKLPANLVTIGSTAFNSCKKLTSVEIPGKVTEIGEKAFIDCSGLTSVTLPASLTTIGAAAFSGCTSLESLALPAALTSLGEGAISGCTGLTNLTVDDANQTYSVKDGLLMTKDGKTLLLSLASNTVAEIPDGVETIATSAFEKCDKITRAVLPSSVKAIGESAFYGCSALSYVELNKGLEEIGEYAFGSCTGLEIMVIPNSVVTLGRRVFSKCSALRQVIIGNGVTSVPAYAFGGCTALADVTVGNSVASLGSYAFESCRSLVSIELPSSVKTISEGAFSECGGLASIVFGAGLEVVDQYAFYGTALKSVTALGAVPAEVSDSYNFTEDMYYDAILYVKSSALNAYKTAEPWRYFENVKEIMYLLDVYSVSPKTGSELRAIRDINVTFDISSADSMPMSIEDAYKLVTLTPEDGVPVYPESITPVEGEKIVSLIFSFPLQTAAGKYTFNLPEGCVYEVMWNDNLRKYTRIDDKGNKSVTAEYTVSATARTVFSNYILTPATRTTLARLSALALTFPDAEYALDIDKSLTITLTQQVSGGAAPAVYYGSIGGWGNERKIYFTNSEGKNVVVSDDGTWLLDIPAGCFSQNGVGSDRIRATYYIDSDMEAVYSSDPEDKSKLERPEGSIMEIYFDFYNSTEVVTEPAIQGASIHVTYGSGTLQEVSDATVAKGWQLLGNMGETFVTIRVNSCVFENDGVLSIKIDRGAFTIDGNPSPAIVWSGTCGEPSGIVEIVTAEDGGKIYNLQGICVGEDWNSLPSGVYIRSGKKIVKN